MHTADEGLQVRVPVTRRRPRGERLVRAPLLGARGHPAAAAARLRAHDERAVSRQPRGGHRGRRRAASTPRPAGGRRRSPSRAAALRLPAGDRPTARRRARGASSSSVATRAYRRPVTAAELDTLMRFYADGRAGRAASTPASSAASSACWPRRLSLPRRARAGGAGAGRDLSAERSRPGVAALVLPVEQRARRRAADRRRARPAARARRCCSGHVRRMLPTPRVARARRQLRAAVAEGGQGGRRRARRGRVPRVRREPAPGHAGGDAGVPGRPARARSPGPRARDRATTASSTTGWRATTAWPACTAATSGASRSPTACAAGCSGRRACSPPRRIPNRTSPVLRGRWLLDTVLGSPPPPPPPDVPSLEQASRRARAEPARADGGAPQEPGVRHLPRADGSARLLARAVRRARPVARGARAPARSTPAATLPDGSRFDGAARAARVPGRSSRRLRAHVHREAARVRARARAGAGRHAGRARHRARRGAGQYRWSAIVGHRAERTVPHGVGERRTRDATAGRRVAAVI